MKGHEPGAADPHVTQRYFAHTAEDEQGNRLPPESGKWQPLADHLRNVAELAARFAAPMGPAAETEARLAGFSNEAAVIIAAASHKLYFLNQTTFFNPCQSLAIDL